MARYWVLPQGDAVMPYSELSQDMYELVGNKNANLADIRNTLELLTPDGFAITTSAFRAFLEKNGLDAYLQQVMASWDPDDETATEEIASDIQKQFLSGGFPLEVTRQIQSAIERLQEKSPRKSLFDGSCKERRNGGDACSGRSSAKISWTRTTKTSDRPAAKPCTTSSGLFMKRRSRN